MPFSTWLLIREDKSEQFFLDSEHEQTQADHIKSQQKYAERDLLKKYRYEQKQTNRSRLKKNR